MHKTLSWLLLIVLPFSLHAQSAFREGLITYHADTVRRLEPHPAAYIATHLLVYRKAGATRSEVWRRNYRNPADTKKEVQVRNLAGTYTWIEYSDSTRAAHGNFALFVSYEEEQQLQQAQALAQPKGKPPVGKVVQRVQWLGLPAERITRAVSMNEPSEAVVTKAMDLSLGALFPAVLSLPGTPLQFTDGDRGWLIQYTAKKLQPQSVSDNLFVVDPRLKVISLTESRQMISDFD
jgi:hypothetical protein